MNKGDWTFLSNHGRIIAYLARYHDVIIQDIAQEADLSIAGVQKIIADLERDGYLTRSKVGRRNQYIIHPEKPLRHRLERNCSVGDLLEGFGISTRYVDEREKVMQAV